MEDLVLQFQDTTATQKIFSLKKKIRAVYGGTGASKTVSIIVWCIDYSQTTKNKIVSIVAESYPHLELGAIRTFKAIMKDRGYWDENYWNETKHIYTFQGGTIIEFLSVDKLGKAHGPRRDILFLNECNYIDWGIVDQLMARTREVIWLDWNPTNEFWYHTEIEGKRDDVDLLKLTFLDNEGLPETERAEIESRRNRPNWWKVYGLGELGEIEGRIYTGWQIIDEIPHEARLEGYGVDFGYDPDPAAIVAVHYYNGGYIFDQVLYARGIDNPTIAKMFKNLLPGLVVADSAEPKSIAEIASFGVNIIGASKGNESVRYGVKTLQSQRISITSRSLDGLKEYRNYIQAVDKKTNIPIMGRYEGEAHFLDAARYKLCSLIPIQRRKEMLAHLPKFPNLPQSNPV